MIRVLVLVAAVHLLLWPIVLVAGTALALHGPDDPYAGQKDAAANVLVSTYLLPACVAGGLGLPIRSGGLAVMLPLSTAGWALAVAGLVAARRRLVKQAEPGAAVDRGRKAGPGH